ncbi:hypothetical protein J5J86_13900 [Aquabacter sp. L1I39]|uniref:hypothetical protein n=1 Tax=Aquabacter sp. L1I39 TaxID=2820278 RepID=UPI001AD9F908|nr:hypothetical protein [Aquabacter sp. L1I39]QTL01899.1 hypothetical protein J5J86_13900 [Aquabacter sp. L1I39]
MLGLGLSLSSVRSSGLLPETIAAASRMSVPPPAAQLAAMDRYIRGQIAAGIWARWDVFCALAAHDAQATRVNWVSSSYGLALNNTLIWRSNRGVQGDGATGFLEATGYNPSAGGTRYAQNDMSLGCYVVTPASAVVGLDVYSGYGRVQRRTSGSNDVHYRANDATGTSWPSGGSLDGLMVADRADAATKRLYRNGALVHSAEVASTGNSTLLRVFAAGAGTALSDAELALIFAGASLSASQHAALASLTNSYLTTIASITP